MSEQNKALIRGSFDAVGKQDLAAFQKALAPKFHAVFTDVAKRAHMAFPDMRITVDDMISEGDKVVTRWTMTGTHKGQARQSRLGEVKPTGRPVKIEGITIHEIQNSVIVNTWGVTGKLEALEQLGLVGEFAKVAQQHH